jgi:predicted dehydrogenase
VKGLPRVGLVGATGHGASHLRRLIDLRDNESIEIAGIADIRPVTAPAPVFTDYRDLIAQTAPEVLIVCTPPHTHLPIAVDAARAGCDLLLEKPPVLSMAEHEELSTVVSETGVACQIGFQALGSPALDQLCAAVRDGRLGEVTGISAVGAWWRGDDYFHRVPWAGRRSVDGRPVLDGAVVNAFAHALMDALVVAGLPRPTGITVERFRVLSIEVEDTAALRVETGTGPPILMAVSLRSAAFIPGEIQVYGTGGHAVLEYPTDRLRLPGEAGFTTVPGRVDLLANLLDHRSIGTPLRCPPATTAPFTAIAETLYGAPIPTTIDHEWLHDFSGTGSAPGAPFHGGRAITGIADLVGRAGAAHALFSELSTPWAGSGPWHSEIGTSVGTSAGTGDGV